MRRLPRRRPDDLSEPLLSGDDAGQAIARRRRSAKSWSFAPATCTAAADPDSPMRWRLSAAAGGGVIADLASHVLDLVDWLIGPFRSVTADPHRLSPAPGAADPPSGLRSTSRTASLPWRGCSPGARARSRPPSWPPAARTNCGWRSTVPRGARLNGMDPHYLEFLRRHGGRAAGRRAGLDPDRRRPRYPPPATGFPNPKAAMGWIRSHVACLADFLRRSPRTGPPCRGSIRAFACST